jgi:hypothetical protein
VLKGLIKVIKSIEASYYLIIGIEVSKGEGILD